MFTITSQIKTQRRRFLEIGASGVAGLSLPTLLRARSARAETGDASFGRAKRCLFIFLNGGPSQLDMWDMKPDAPAEVRGELNPIATNVPGIQVGELLPLTAQHCDKYKIVRSVTSENTVHTTGVYTMLTGARHLTPMVDQLRAKPEDHPHLGSIIAKALGWKNGVPPFVCLPSLFKAPPVEGIWPGQNAGFLGQRYAPFVVEGEKLTAIYKTPALESRDDLSARRLQDRQQLLRRIDRGLGIAESSDQFGQIDTFYEQAFSLVGSSHVQRAMDLNREPAKVRDRYGRHLFGQGILLARRLMEADVRIATVYWNDPKPAGAGGGEYDSHGRIYHHMRNRLVPPTDQALSALFEDLAQRSLLDDTLVVITSEFGRTPRINAGAGRDHWPWAQSILLAGAGITGGTVFGSTDRHAAYPATNPVTPPDLAQTLFHLLGVPADLQLQNHEGRAVMASLGTVMPALFA